jgi:hypothetical protein
LKYPSASNLRWLGHSGIDLAPDYRPSDIDDETADRILDAFGLFGTPEECADRLLRARAEVGLRQAFLFPAHSWNNHYELPQAEINAFAQTIGSALRQHESTKR